MNGFLDFTLINIKWQAYEWHRKEYFASKNQTRIFKKSTFYYSNINVYMFSLVSSALFKGREMGCALSETLEVDEIYILSSSC